jgi:phage tail protein X
MTQYLTKQNDILDDVVFRFYGDTEGGIVELVLEANREISLADYGHVLPAGITITLPERVTEQAAKTITKLWD